MTVGNLELSTGQIITSLERPWLDNQVSVSCIPKGIYKVTRDKTGKHTWFRLEHVEGRTFIEIHEGYRVEHSEGCILFSLIELQDLMIDTKGEDFELEIT